MSNNLPPLVPSGSCPSSQPVAIATPVLLRSALEGPPISFQALGAGAIIDPAGADNEIIVAAKELGASGNLISVQITPPVTGIVTSTSVIGTAISIIPASRARMVVTGAGDVVFNGTYRHSGNYPGTSRPYWTKIGGGVDTIDIGFPHPDAQTSGEWTFRINGITKYISPVVVYDQTSQPESLTYTPINGASNPPPATSGSVSDAGQAINAIALSLAAFALIEASPVGLSTGAVNTLGAIFLTGGEDQSLGTNPIAIGQLCRAGPYTIIPPRTQAYDWFIAETMDSWRQIFE